MSGSYFARACFTAVMFVTAPPIATRASGAGRPSIRPGRGDRGEGVVQHVGRDGAIEAEALGVAHCAHFDTEPLVDARAMPEGELRTATARVENHQRSFGQAKPCFHCEISEAPSSSPGMISTVITGSCPDRRDDVVGVASDPQAGGAHRRDRHARQFRFASATMLSMAAGRSVESRRGDLAGSPRGPRRAVSARRDRRWCASPVGCAFADVELDRVRADIDHGVARWHVIDDGG